MEGLEGDGSFNFELPSMLNQPAMKFGNYDGSPIATSLPANMFDDNSSTGMDDHLDAKRRRIARVCLANC